MILIVDDHLDTGVLLARLLRRCGYEAVAVTSGRAALSLLRDTRPSVVILDKDMPDMGGLDVLRAVRSDARARDIPVIMYTADADAKSADEARRLGAQDYLVKGHTPLERVCATVGQYAHA